MIFICVKIFFEEVSYLLVSMCTFPNGGSLQMLYFSSIFLSLFACQKETDQLSEEVTSQIVNQVVQEVLSELEALPQNQITTENIKELIQEEIQKNANTPKFDPVKHRQDLLSNNKTNRQFGELYVRVTGIDAYPKNNFKSRMESAGRSKIRSHAQSKNIPVSSLDMEDMKVQKATCDDGANRCSANFRLKYKLN
jgi:hypothetical protein